MVDKAQKTKILMENFKKYIISENNIDEMELNKYARTLYSILKKNGIQVSIAKNGNRVVNSQDNSKYDRNTPSAIIYVWNQSGQPLLRCSIYNMTNAGKDVWKQIRTSLPNNIEMREELNAGVNLFFRIKSENISETKNQKNY